MHDSSSPWPRRAGLLLACLFAVSIAHTVYRIPIQVSDSLDAILYSRESPSSLALFERALLASSTTLRPVRYLQARWLTSVAEASGLSYHAVFRGLHAAIAAALIGLVTWIVNPRRWINVAALGFALTVLIGLPSIDAILRESFPVNHYAEVAVAALFVLGAALRPPRLWREVLALLLLIGGLLLIEAAVLIWLVIVACAAVRLPGMRLRTGVTATLILVGILVLRVRLDISSPGIGSHTAGWGATLLSNDELEARFSANPLPFFAYNIVGGGLSLMLSEPRFGVYQVLDALERRSLSPVIPINIISSFLLTALIAWACWRAARTRAKDWTDEHRTLAVGVLVAALSAALCITYIKDDILATGGAFYAVMAAIAMGWMLERVTLAKSGMRLSSATFCLLTLACLWAFRSVGTHYELRRTAFVTRNDWVHDSVEVLAGGESATPQARLLTRRIRREAIDQPVTSPYFLPHWGERYWVE